MDYRRQTLPGRHGVAATELALLLPLLCFFFVVAVDFARVFYVSLTVANCARSGAIYGCQNPTTALDTSGIQAVAQMDASNLNSQNLNVSPSTDSSSNPSTVTVTVTYPFSTITNYPLVGGTRTITRTVTMSVSPWTPN